MSQFNILSRRSFLSYSFKTSMAVALSTLVDIPFVLKRALADGNIGLNGKKLLFIWLRFGNDGLNSVVPIQDPQYIINRPDIKIPVDAGTDYTVAGPCDYPIGNSTLATYHYGYGIRTGNGFAALHPSLKFLAPVYNAGDLAIIHRVGYPKQSRSHFDSQNYWENGNPNKNIIKDGIFYRTILESGLANSSALTGVSVQSALPLLLRGSQAAMTNLTDPNRYDLLGVPTPGADLKAANAIAAANHYPFPNKLSREMLQLQYQNMSRTLDIFAGIDFDENYVNAASPGNYYRDAEITDGDSDWATGTASINPADANRGYYLFPTTDAKNGGYTRSGATNGVKQLVPTSAYGFFKNLKAAAMILNKTDAIIAGTEIGGFDTHQNQGGIIGSHANLQRSIGWAMYALRKYFTQYSERVNWDDVVVVTLSEFGRTSVENSDNGTDHAEACPMFVAGGAVKGYGAGNTSGLFGVSPGEAIPWKTGPRDPDLDKCGTMFAANTGVAAGYLRRSCDYRSVLGEIIRKHLGATQNQLNRIIPGYAVPGRNAALGRHLGGGRHTNPRRSWDSLGSRPQVEPESTERPERRRGCSVAGLVLALLCGWFIPGSCGAALLTLIPSADTSLMEVAPTNNNGAQQWLLSGTTQNTPNTRALMRFDLSALPAHSIIRSARLILAVTRQPMMARPTRSSACTGCFVRGPKARRSGR